MFTVITETYKEGYKETMGFECTSYRLQNKKTDDVEDAEYKFYLDQTDIPMAWDFDLIMILNNDGINVATYISAKMKLAQQKRNEDRYEFERDNKEDWLKNNKKILDTK